MNILAKLRKSRMAAPEQPGKALRRAALVLAAGWVVLFLSCESPAGGSSDPDTTRPGIVSGLHGTPGEGTVTLTWTDPMDRDLDHIEISFEPPAAGIGQPISVILGIQTRTITGLDPGTAYTFIVQAVDAAGNKSAGVSTGSITPRKEPPGDVTGLTGTPAGGGKITLTWTDPSDSGFDHIEITWSPGGDSPVTVSKGARTYTAAALTPGTAYTFTVKAVDAAGNKSAGKQTGPHTPPGPAALISVTFTGLPQDETITLTGAENTISWAAKAALTVSVGGGTFTGYRWVLDGAVLPDETTNSLTLNADSLWVKEYSLTVFVTADGKEYTKRVTFTVSP
jgi:chitodextrinase